MYEIDEFKPHFLTLERGEQLAAVEALIFSAEEPLNLDTLYDILIADITEKKSDDLKQSILERLRDQLNFDREYLADIIHEINIQLESTSRAFRIVDYAEGYQFATKPEFGELLQRLVRAKTRRRLSRAALEVLAIIAYSQPISKPGIEQIRGVNSSEVVNTLLEKKLVIHAGRSDGLGKPLLYGTSDEFLIQFGMNSLADLPKLKELEELIEGDVNIEEYKEDYIIRANGNEENDEIENGIPKIINNKNGYNNGE